MDSEKKQAKNDSFNDENFINLTSLVNKSSTSSLFSPDPTESGGSMDTDDSDFNQSKNNNLVKNKFKKNLKSRSEKLDSLIKTKFNLHLFNDGDCEQKPGNAKEC